ncbi:PREDICTED: uncharacterized protein LOC104597186 [Nelumbo nucifera]|uniref:Uncharacterized protein LOC104597186 n=1 Tax=Nelumbo nucifera TaxID=4432 RepID=A0A1U7ZXB7_NELNU|nr:PREDICTED: uncharacterized protein LOC104597186 [Nelumbo nucifera]
MLSTATLRRHFPQLPVARASPSSDTPAVSSGVWSMIRTTNERNNLGLFHSILGAKSKSPTQVYAEVSKHGSAVIEWLDTVNSDEEGEAHNVLISKEIAERVSSIK